MANEYGMGRTHRKLLPMLVDIDRVCRDNNIKYSLCAGTLLGAIRHKGFIPWDDDIDICFERDEYEKFLDVYIKDGDPDYCLNTSLNKCRYSLTSSRVGSENKTIGTEEQEPWVSIFVFDKVPEGSIKASLKVFLIKLIMGMMGKPPHYHIFCKKTKVLFTITSVMGKPFSEEFKRKLHTSISKWGNDSNSQYITRYNTYIKEILWAKYPQRILDSYIDISFEGHQFMAMEGYHEFLELEYGNYMTLPPKDQRIAKHEF